MEHTRVRKVPATPYPLPSEKWDDEWLRPILNLTKRFAAYTIQHLASLSGPATLMGGMLWSVLLVLLYLNWASVWLDHFDFRFHWYLYYLDFRLLIVPMLLFIIGLISLYSRYSGSFIKIERVGFWLSVVGLAMVVLTTFGIEWFRLDVWMNRLVTEENDFDTLFVVLNMSDPFDYLSLYGWFKAAHFGFATLSIGLLLLCITALRSRAFPVWVGVVLLISTVSIHLLSLSDALLVPHYEYGVEEIYNIGILSLLVVFGVSWATVGYALLQQGKPTKTSR